MRLQVLLVEDELDDLRQYERDFPSVFSSHRVEADIHPCGNFDDAFALTSNPLYRYDLIISDTYRSPIQNRDAQVMRMVNSYRGTRFCPLVVYSSGPKPEELEETAFIVWADKGRSGDIERAINQLLDTNIPQLARKLHNELERSAGSYLWGFLESNWDTLRNNEITEPIVLERIIRRRAATQLGRLNPTVDEPEEINVIDGSKFYIYPRISESIILGEILIHRTDNSFSVVVTPHCHLEIQPEETHPRADYLLAIKAFPAIETIAKASRASNGTLQNPWTGNQAQKIDKLRRRIQSPADLGKPRGRYWFLPSFLKIPDLYCDFLQVESIPYDTVNNETEYERVAVLDSPFAEAFQSSFARFYAAVGIANLQTEKFRRLVQENTIRNP